jgi:hypothetical protein
MSGPESSSSLQFLSLGLCPVFVDRWAEARSEGACPTLKLGWAREQWISGELFSYASEPLLSYA